MPQNHTAIISKESITIFLDGEAYTVKRGDENFTPALLAVGEGRWDDVPPLVSRGFLLQKWAQGDFTFADGLMHYKSFPLPHQLNERMLVMAKEKTSPEFLLKFWELLQGNPSKRSVTQLYDFLAHQNIPIDEDGYILAYKSVRRNYMDHHTGKVDNSVGAVPEMPRNHVDDDPHSACSDGYHLGALSYAQGFGGASKSRLMVCKVNPADVVSIPRDSSSRKMRVCKYKVIGHYGEALPSTVYDTEQDEALQAEPSGVTEVDLNPGADLAFSADNFAATLGNAFKSGKRKPAKKAPAPVATPAVDLEAKPWLAFPAMSDEEVSKQKGEHLRKYASRLGIVNSSRMKKADVLARILDVRE
jgi:hypothetical protein